jgi:hypothetical protein
LVLKFTASSATGLISRRILDLFKPVKTQRFGNSAGGDEQPGLVVRIAVKVLVDGIRGDIDNVALFSLKFLGFFTPDPCARSIRRFRSWILS